MNFARDVVGAQPPDRTALIERTRDGERRTLTFDQIDDRAARFAGALAARGVGRGDVVMTLVGNRVEWIDAMVACFRMGAAVLPCTEQLRPHDLALRLRIAAPRAIVADVRNREALEAALAEVAGDGDPPVVLLVPDPELLAGPPAPAADLDPLDDCLVSFTSGTTGEPKAMVHGQRYLAGQALQAEHWLGAREGDVVWCTAASGWSKSARNVFVAPWLRGATALIHDARFDPAERLDLAEEERVTVLCMAPTEYRLVAKRAELRPLPALRELVAAGEALNPEVLEAWRSATGLSVRDGFGQTETGQLTGAPAGAGTEVRPGSMGRPLPGIRAWIEDGELVVDPATVPTFFVRRLDARQEDADGGHGAGGDRRADAALEAGGRWGTGDRVREDEDGWLYFEGRGDDVIISSGYRIGPFEVESALVEHPDVVEAAVVAAPDPDRGSVVRAVVVLRDGVEGDDALKAELVEHVKARTAPYKHPRIVDVVDALPKTDSGKVRRNVLREG